MNIPTYRGRLAWGWLLIVLGSLWCWEAYSIHAPAESGLPGSLAVLAGAGAVRSAMRNRRRIREVRQDAEIWQGGVGYPTNQGEEARAARRAARDRDLWGRG